MTDAQTEARAIATVRKWLDGGCSSWGLPSQEIAILITALAAKNEELAVVKSKCQALDDECQQSMLDIARERDRAERAEAQLAEALKALDALDRMSRGVDWCDQDEQARRWSAARRALTGGKEDG